MADAAEWPKRCYTGVTAPLLPDVDLGMLMNVLINPIVISSVER